MSINFSIPNTPSVTKTTPDGPNTIFVPDINYLTKFAKGDLGIADEIKSSAIINTVASSKNKEATDKYLKLAGGNVSSPEKYLNNGRYSIPKSALTLDTSKNQFGLKALEKSVIQSIFDTQKPYMDMFGQLSNVLITVEDIIARVLALGEKSLKPSTNPRALGFKKNGENVAKNELGKLASLSKNSPDFNTKKNNVTSTDEKHWEIQSIVYSTGDYKPNVNYDYEYIDILNPDINISGTNSVNTNSKLPQTIIVAVFDNEGNIISDDDIINDKYNLSWLKSSGKWSGNFNYLSRNENLNVDLYTQYYKDYALENIPESTSELNKLKAIEKINLYCASDNFKNIKDNITSLKDNCYNKSVQYNNSSLLFTYNNSYKNNKINMSSAPFAPKKINSNWIDPESDYDLKLIRCDAVDKQNDDDINKPQPYSTGIYGGDDNGNEDIAQIYRNVNNDTSNDTIFKIINGLVTDEVLSHKTYYILEGINAEINNQSFNKTNDSDNGFSYYKKKSFFSAPGQFVKLLVSISTKLAPSIEAISNIGSNPVKFVTDVMLSNLGDNNGTKDTKFIFFSSEFTKKFMSLEGSNNKKSIIKNSILKNYVYLDKNNEPKFLLEGSGFSFLKKIKIGNKISSNMKFATFSSIYPVEPLPNNLKNSINYSTLKFTSYKEGETIDYIGGYDPNKTYKYIYVTEYQLGLLREAQEMENTGDMTSALSKYTEAQKLDPSNEIISNKIKDIKKLISSYGGNALFSFILNMITMPLEIVLGIVEEVIKLLQKFTNPLKLKEAITDVVSFKIFPGGLNPTDFFKPQSMLKLAKIDFNIDLFLTWISTIFVAPLPTYDLNKIIQLPFVSSFPKYSTEQFKSLIFGHGKNKPNILPLKMLTGILKIFEGIINAIISFFWALMGIEGLLKKPVLKFTKDSNTDVSADDIQALINGTYTDVINPNSSTASNFNFIYNIQLPDGRTLRQLNQIELEDFIQNNSNFIYQYKI